METHFLLWTMMIFLSSIDVKILKKQTTAKNLKRRKHKVFKISLFL